MLIRNVLSSSMRGTRLVRIIAIADTRNNGLEQVHYYT